MMKFNQFKHSRILMFAVTFILVQCTLVEDELPQIGNPLDPNDPNFIPVETIILEGPADNDTLTTHTVTFRWSGNENVVEYSTQLDGQGWQEWSVDTTLSFSYLDEGIHTFKVKGRYHEEAEDETPASRLFVIDAVQGPALIFSPRLQEIAGGSIVSIDVYAEEVQDLIALNAIIEFDKEYLKFESATVYEGSLDLLTKNGGSVSRILKQEDGLNAINANLAIVGGSPYGVSGSGSLIQLRFSVLKTGLTILTYGLESKLINKNLDEILPLLLLDARVEVTS